MPSAGAPGTSAGGRRTAAAAAAQSRPQRLARRAGTRTRARDRSARASIAEPGAARSGRGRGRAGRRSARGRPPARAAGSTTGTARGNAARAGRTGRRRRGSSTASAVLPHRLHRAVAPAVALPPQLAERGGRLGPGAGALLVDDPPAGAADRHRQVGVLGERVVADAADLEQGAAPERADRARAPSACSCSASYRRRSRLKPITYSMCCQRPSRPAPVADLGVAGDRADPAGSANGCTSVATASRLEDGVAVDHHDDLVRGRAGDAGVERRRLAAVGAGGSPARSGRPRASTMSAVPSVEPSSTTMISIGMVGWRPASARSRRWPPPRCRRARSR